ncbi:uncharacterized protein EI90DRAFT_1614845 [Cantharellus anzutake]|uniref:uncharacterized protein n=1 Tax=Cantharellus anzutake TaxID=1750568 RepID=UPI0019041E20|nr:uncharacterized protein EI90DRAFT_1614845 [Cantharellus anzutake]KAF8328212.1 hypothetical protein EI90DRAFT_1614845 [Cantharellus anzutake]
MPMSEVSQLSMMTRNQKYTDQMILVEAIKEKTSTHLEGLRPPRYLFPTQPASTSTRSGTQPHHRVNTKPIPNELIDPHLLEQSSARNIGATIKKLVYRSLWPSDSVSRLTSEVRELVKMNGQLEQEWSEKHEALLEEVAELRGEILKIKSTPDSGPKQPAKTGRLTELDVSMKKCCIDSNTQTTLP